MVVVCTAVVVDGLRYTFSVDPTVEFVSMFKRERTAARVNTKSRLFIQKIIFPLLIVVPQVFSLLELTYVTMYDLSIILSTVVAFAGVKSRRHYFKKSVGAPFDLLTTRSYAGTLIFSVTLWFILIRPIINLTLTWLTISVMGAVSIITASSTAITHVGGIELITMFIVGSLISIIKLFITVVQIYFLSVFSKSLGSIFK